MADCIFCDIISGQLPSSMVYQDGLCSAFMDIQPINSGHLLVIPNHHAQNLAELDEPTGAHLFTVAMRLSTALRRSGIKCEGVNHFLADGEAAGQEVFHVHLHVFPRYKGDDFGIKFPPGYLDKPDRLNLDANAQRIKDAVSEGCR